MIGGWSFLGFWSLELGASLELGTWDLGLGKTVNLEFAFYRGIRLPKLR